MKIENNATEILKFAKAEFLATDDMIDDMETILSTMSSKEEIEYAFLSTFLYHNKMSESIVNAICWITNKKLYYIGKNGKSSVFVSGKNSRIMASIELKDVHSIGSGKTFLQGHFITFEVKNEDFKFQSVGLDCKTIISVLNKAIEIAKENVSKEGQTFVQELSAADELKKFKELLDMGVITQEEFDAKKKQLLGL